MPLSAEEQRRLAELEQSLAQDDPAFARTFQRHAPRSSRSREARSGRGRTVACAAGLVLGVGLLIAGVEWTPVVGVLGFVVMLVSVVLWVGPGSRTRPSGHRGNAGSPGPRARAPKARKGGRSSGQSFTERMEDRWRRRSRGEL